MKKQLEALEEEKTARELHEEKERETQAKRDEEAKAEEEEEEEKEQVSIHHPPSTPAAATPGGAVSFIKESPKTFQAVAMAEALRARVEELEALRKADQAMFATQLESEKAAAAKVVSELEASLAAAQSEKKKKKSSLKRTVTFKSPECSDRSSERSHNSSSSLTNDSSAKSSSARPLAPVHANILANDSQHSSSSSSSSSSSAAKKRGATRKSFSTQKHDPSTEDHHQLESKGGAVASSFGLLPESNATTSTAEPLTRKEQLERFRAEKEATRQQRQAVTGSSGTSLGSGPTRALRTGPSRLSSKLNSSANSSALGGGGSRLMRGIATASSRSSRRLD